MTVSKEVRAAARAYAQQIDDSGVERGRPLGAGTDPYSLEGALLERRLRHRAAKLGLKVIKSRARDRHAHDFGLWGLRNVATGAYVNPPLVAGFPFPALGGWIRSRAT